MTRMRVPVIAVGALGLLGVGCLQVEDVPLADAGVPSADLGTEPLDAGSEQDWPAVVYNRNRHIFGIKTCGSTLLWPVQATVDDLGNRRSDAEVWAWDAGGSPLVLAANLADSSQFPFRAVGCHDGLAYWNEFDGGVSSLHARVTSGSADAVTVRDGNWSMGDDGLVASRSGPDQVEIFSLVDGSATVVDLDLPNPANPLEFWPTATYLYRVGLNDGGSRVPIPVGAATWEPIPIEADAFVPAVGRVILRSNYSGGILYEVLPSGEQVILARRSGKGITSASQRGGWMLWAFEGASGDMEVGRSAIDHQGNVRVQLFPELSIWATDILMAEDDRLPGSLAILQFGQQIAIADVYKGTIRLVEEPPFPCVDATLPCPEGATCSSTVCAELPD